MQIESTRFGRIEIRDDAVLTFPEGLIGLPGTSYALLSQSPDAVFYWLQSLEDPSLALPVTTPWLFFPGYRVELSDEDAGRLGMAEPEQAGVMCIVRAAESLDDFRINLRGPIVIERVGLVARQVINAAGDHGVSEPLFVHVPLEAVTPVSPPAPVAATGV